jgi:CRP/FNR family transcriptional regulator, cyclic AMP receptor protein
MARKQDEKLTWLARVLPLEGLSDAELDVLGNTSDRVTFPAGHVLARQGEVGREAFVIIEGEVEIRRDGEVLATTGPGGVVGELAVLGGWRRTADIVAVGDLEALVFDVRSFQKAIHVSDRLRRHVEQAVIDHSVSS